MKTKDGGDPALEEAEMRQKRKLKIQGKEFTKEPQNQQLYCVLCKNIGSAFSTNTLYSFHLFPSTIVFLTLNRVDSAFL